MSILEEVNLLLNSFGVPVETGIYSSPAPESYVLITPMADVYNAFADNTALIETQEVRISIFTKGSYTALKNRVVKELLKACFTITARVYLGYEDSYHHYAIDLIKEYTLEEEAWQL